MSCLFSAAALWRTLNVGVYNLAMHAYSKAAGMVWYEDSHQNPARYRPFLSHMLFLSRL